MGNLWAASMAIILASIVWTCVAAAITIAIYVLYSYFLYKLAKKQNIDNAWLSWVPVARMYILLMLCAQADFVLFGNWTLKNRSYAFWAYLGLAIASMLSNRHVFFFSLMGVGLLITVAQRILIWRMVYDLLHTYHVAENSEMLMAVLCAVVPFIGLPVACSCCDKKQPDYSYMG